MLYILIAHKSSHSDYRDSSRNREGVFYCEEHDSSEAIERRVHALVAQHGDFDSDDLFVYEIDGRDGDAYYRGDDTPNTAQKFLNIVMPRIRADRQAAKDYAEEQKRVRKEARRVADEKAERTYYERLKEKFEPKAS